jgi:AcrR family transcriptional regulator
MVSELTRGSSGSSKDAIVEEFRTQTILEAALRVIARKGAGATMLEIAHEAGIAKGTIYLYFRSREILLERVLGFARKGLLAELEQVLREPRPFSEQLRVLVRTKFDFFQKHLELFRVYKAIQDAEGAQACHKKADQEVYVERLAAFFSEAMQRGEIRRTDPFRLALFFTEGVVAILFQKLEEPPTDPKKDADFVVALMLSGLEKNGSEP